MPKATLNQHFINSVTCPESKTKENYYDTAIAGFIVEVRTNGKTYALRYRDEHKRQRQYKIGNAEDISFSKAQNMALRLRSKVVLGEDPAKEKRTNRRIVVPTFAEFCRDKYMPFVKSYKRSHDSDDSYLRNHLLPRYGNLPINTLTEETVLEFKHSMRSNRYAMGTINRGLALLSYIFNLAIRWKVPGVTSNPAASVKLYVANNERQRYVTAEETKRLYVELEKSGNPQLKSIVGLLLQSRSWKTGQVVK